MKIEMLLTQLILTYLFLFVESIINSKTNKEANSGYINTAYLKYFKYFKNIKAYNDRYTYVKNNIKRMKDVLISLENSNSSNFKTNKYLEDKDNLQSIINYVTDSQVINKKSKYKKEENKVVNSSNEKYVFSSNLSNNNSKSRSTQQAQELYNFYTYEDMVDLLNKYKEDYKDLFTLDTANSLLKIEKPASQCGDKDCEVYICKLARRDQITIYTPQILITCGIDGDEGITQLACIEFITLLLTNYNSNDWIKYLLDNREIVIIPLLNPSGFYLNRKEEFVNTDKNYFVDVGKDFPYLRSKETTLKSTSSKIIDSIIKQGLFRFSINLKTKENAITYPWLTPSHVRTSKSSKNKKSNDDELRNLYNEMDSNDSLLTKISGFINGKFDNLYKSPQCSNPPPDIAVFKNIAKLVSMYSDNFLLGKYLSTPKQANPLKIGRASSIFIPLIGDIDDYIYGFGSESSNIMQGKTNAPVEEKIKIAPFSIYISKSISPSREELGVKNTSCLLNLYNTAFYALNLENDNVDNLKNCLTWKINQSNGYNGIIPRSIRSLLLFADLTLPYVIIRNYELFTQNNNRFTRINFTVGGAVSVKRCYVIYITNDNLNQQFEDAFSNQGVNNFDLVNNYGYLYSNSLYNIQPVWRTNNHQEVVSEIIIDINSRISSYSKYVVICEVNELLKQEYVNDINTFAVSHVANEFEPSYYSGHSFTIKGQIYDKVIKGKRYVHSKVVTCQH